MRIYRSNRIMLVAGVLLYLVIVSTSILAGLSARYTAKANGEDGAQVAAYVFCVNDQEGTLTIPVNMNEPGNTYSYTCIVTNKNEKGISEVAQEYELTLELEGSLPIIATMVKSGETDGVSLDAMTAADASVSFPLRETWKGTMEAAKEVKDVYMLTISWPDETARKDIKFAGGVAQIELDFVSAQID